MRASPSPSAAGPPRIPGPAPFTTGRLPRIRFGAGTFAALPEVLEAYGRRALIVTGNRSFRASERWPWLLAQLEARSIGQSAASVSGEPSPDAIDAIVADHRQDGIQVVVGIGGGSALDAAKAVAGLLPSGRSVRDHLEGVGRQLPYDGPSLPFVAVPTTAGTGSEVTRNAVITERGAAGFKRSFRDERLVAQEAIVDPELLIGAPVQVLAANGLDAVTQLLEAYVSRRAGPLADALALDGLQAARWALPAWHQATIEGQPEAETAAARAAMAYAALLSGICLANTGLGAAHGLASPLGAHFAIPHGVACGAVLVAVVEANLAALGAAGDAARGATRAGGAAGEAAQTLRRYARLGRLLGEPGDPSGAGEPGDRSGSSATTDDQARASLLVWLRDLVANVETPGLAVFGIRSEDIPQLVAESRGSSMRTNPIELSDEALSAILERSL
jgi:alcohol dehydrogenase class IV